MEETEQLRQFKSQIKAEALRLGFSACGMASVENVEEDIRLHFGHWLKENHQAGMDYMNRYEAQRMNPLLLLEGARTILSLALNYYPSQQIPEKELQLSWYAYGKDYHEVMKVKLRQLLEYIETLTSPDFPAGSSAPFSARICVDTAPILERYWAWKAGIGWIGKNTQLILPGKGSCFFLGEILLNLELPADQPAKNRCGHCKRCLKACPGQALIAPYTLNSGKCISYQTIENRGTLSPESHKILENRIYGCDECQKVCPHNRFARPTTIEEFHPSPALLAMTREKWEKLTLGEFRILFKNSAVKRSKYEGLARNIRATTKDNLSKD